MDEKLELRFSEPEDEATRELEPWDAELDMSDTHNGSGDDMSAEGGVEERELDIGDAAWSSESWIAFESDLPAMCRGEEKVGKGRPLSPPA